MKILKSTEDVQNLMIKTLNEGKSIGFVPTMGALHLGHISLVQAARKENDLVVVSIFVNPTQFNNPEDLKKYPRTEEADLEKLKMAKVDAVFVPSVEVMYPEGEKSQSFDFKGLENQMEGAFRPGHFDGVGTVVKRLFELTMPTRAYFGEKDFQQLRIIQEMVKIEQMEVEIVPVEIMREEDGLAMSSRNMRLTQAKRQEAPVIYELLQKAKAYYQSHTAQETIHWVKKEFEKTALELEYFELADETTLLPSRRKSKNKKVRAFVAAYADEIRLIDNLAFY